MVRAITSGAPTPGGFSFHGAVGFYLAIDRSTKIKIRRDGIFTLVKENWWSWLIMNHSCCRNIVITNLHYLSRTLTPEYLEDNGHEWWLLFLFTPNQPNLWLHTWLICIGYKTISANHSLNAPRRNIVMSTDKCIMVYLIGPWHAKMMFKVDGNLPPWSQAARQGFL